MALAADLKQAPVQVRIQEKDRDVCPHQPSCTGGGGGGGGGGGIDQRLNNLQHIYPTEVEGIRRSLYVDDLIGGETTVADERDLKQALQSIFRAGKFELHK